MMKHFIVLNHHSLVNYICFYDVVLSCLHMAYNEYCYIIVIPSGFFSHWCGINNGMYHDQQYYMFDVLCNKTYVVYG